MADATKIIEGFYKNIPIRIDSGSVAGGRKKVKHEFPNRDTNTIEDMGADPRVYTLEIVIAPRTAGGKIIQGYFEYRDDLIAAIESKEPGELVHPLYGRIDNVVAMAYSLNENFTDFGRSTLNVTFEITKDTGIPKQSITALSQLAAANEKVIDAVKTDLTSNFKVTNSFRGNFADAKDKINAIIDRSKTSTAFIGAAAEQINTFNGFIGELSSDINSMVSGPSKLAANIENLFSNIDGLFGTAEATTKAFKGLFGFGSGDESGVKSTTVALVQRKQNRAVINGAINAGALSYAYTNTALRKFDNVRDIETESGILEDQFEIVRDSGASVEVLQAVQDQRVLVQQFFDEQKKVVRQIIDIYTNTIPARVLSYQYYGESATAEEIIALNSIDDVSFVDGDIEILTQ